MKLRIGHLFHLVVWMHKFHSPVVILLSECIDKWQDWKTWQNLSKNKYLNTMHVPNDSLYLKNSLFFKIEIILCIICIIVGWQHYTMSEKTSQKRTVFVLYIYFFQVWSWIYVNLIGAKRLSFKIFYCFQKTTIQIYHILGKSYFLTRL